MTSSIKLDKDMDILFIDGIAQIVSGVDDTIQAIRIELEQNKGQWSLSTEFGTPYLNSENTGILQERDEEKMKKEISKAIMKYPEVERIEKIEFIDNKLKINIKIEGRVVSL